jgi:hypothetical protein
MRPFTSFVFAGSASRVLVVLLALSLSACGQKNDLHQTTGKVLYKGEPAVGAIVYFNLKGADPKTAHTASAVVGEDGTYTLETGRLGEGAAPGEYFVLVRWPVEDRNGNARLAIRNPSDAPDKLKRKYFNPDKPLLEATVSQGRNVIPTFELTD